jgi:hypothetical protein
MSPSQGINYYGLIYSRGFKPGQAFIERFRFKPCAPMLSFISYRMEQFDPVSFEANMRKYFVAQDQFTRAGILCPGYKTRDRAFWYAFVKLIFV